MAARDDEALAPTVMPEIAPPDAGPADSPALDATVAVGIAVAAVIELADGDRYLLGAAIGQGGMGDVLSASDRRIGRDVAIKRTRVVPSPELGARFLREAQIQGRLDHPAIVPVYDLGVDESGKPFFVMKRLTGTVLHDLLVAAAAGDDAGDAAVAGGGRRRLLAAFVDVCLAIEFAHTRGVVHRDLKPSNIMLGDFGEVYVLDWGVARVLRERDAPWAEVVSLDGEPTTSTRAGAVLGTAGYMAPEQARGEAVDARSDVYALGATLFEILVGAPFARGVLDAVDAERTPSRRGADVPPELDAICARALARDPGARWPTARALAQAVQRYLDGDRDQARRQALAAVQLAEAHAALAAADDAEARAAALRGAGRALALDPSSTAAAALVSRLMLAPPAVTPPEVVAEMRAADRAIIRRSARRSMWNFVALCSLLPFAMWQGIHRPIVTAVFLALTGLATLHAGLIAFGKVEPSRARLLVAFTVNITLVALLSRAFGPFLVVPCVAAAVVVSFGGLPMLERPIGLAVLASIVVVAPWVLEASGATPRTAEFVDGGLVLRSASFQMAEVPMTIILLGQAIVVVFIASFAAYGAAAGERSARDQLAIQAWQLRQMMSDRAPATADRDTNEA